MKYLSLFSGIGGFELGIGNKAKCVGYSEIDKYAIQIYEKHFSNHKNYGDITKINPAKLPNFDLVCGGFPCQSFSIAGKRGGFEDTRGTLFFDIARIVRIKRPRYIFLENVKGLLSHDEGDTFATIIQTIDELGYDLQWQVLNSKNFGVPQNRERVFIIGHLRGTSRPQIFPFGENSEANIVLPTITARYYGGQANGGYIGHKPKQIGTLRTHKDGKGFRKIKKDISPTIPVRAREDGSGQPVIMIGSTQENAAIMENRSPALTEAMGKGGGHIPMKLDGLKIRRLTPIECERLQGFPDGWTEGISDTQRYKTLGNAVTVNVIKAISEHLIYDKR